MNIEDWAPISSARLKRIRWRGERSYRILSNSFSLRWNDALLADRINYVFGAFAVPPADRGTEGRSSEDGASTFSLVDLGSRYPRRYRLLLGTEQLLASRSRIDVVNNLLWRLVDQMQRISEFLLVHAGSVVTSRGEGVLLPGDSGSGKTTLVGGLIRDGFTFLSDELGVIDPNTGLVHAFPRALNFKDPSLPLFPPPPAADDLSVLSGRQQYLRAEEIRPGIQAAPTAVRFVIFPRYESGQETRITPLSRAETLKELWPNVVNGSAYGHRALDVLANLVRGATGSRLATGELSEAIRAVEGFTRAS